MCQPGLKVSGPNFIATFASFPLKCGILGEYFARAVEEEETAESDRLFEVRLVYQEDPVEAIRRNVEDKVFWCMLALRSRFQ